MGFWGSGDSSVSRSMILSRQTLTSRSSTSSSRKHLEERCRASRHSRPCGSAPPGASSLFFPQNVVSDFGLPLLDVLRGLNLGFKKGNPTKTEFFIDNLLVRFHLIIEMILLDRPRSSTSCAASTTDSRKAPLQRKRGFFIENLIHSSR